jgi:hypothetical protein
MELRSKKAIECENIDQKYSHIRWLCSRVELQATPVGLTVRKPVAARRNDKKVEATNPLGHHYRSFPVASAAKRKKRRRDDSA